MHDPLENLEVAKLAAALSGQLRRIDKETESSMPANRIDLRKFQQQVVNSANPNAARPVDFGGYQNQDEARMMEYLNRDALNKIPELIPVPPPQQYQPPPQPQPQQIIPVVEPQIQPQIQDNQAVKQSADIINVNSELVTIIKSIDSSLKDLCDYFIDVDFKKNKKTETLKKTKKKITKNISPKQMISPLSKEMEMGLLQEIMSHQKNLQNVE
jgi:Tfp pilus assembly protein PilP